jgi:two-component system cell cycle sensor histidine kinase/response regulator CckA
MPQRRRRRLSYCESQETGQARLEQEIVKLTEELELTKRRLKLEQSERIRVAAALKESDERLGALYEYNPVMYCTIDEVGTILSINSFGAEQLGYTPEELAGRLIRDFCHPEDRETVKQKLSSCISSPAEVARWDMRKVHRSGETLWMRESAHAVSGKNGRPLIYLVCEDITARKLSEEAFNSLIFNAPIGIFIVQKSRFRLLNPGMQAITGYTQDDMLGEDSLTFVVPEHKETVRSNAIRMLKGRRSLPFEFKIVLKDGNTKWLMQTVTPTYFKGESAVLGYFIDITERKQLESQLFQAQQMEAVGRLAGGIAHDFNNLLTAIIGYADILRLRLGEEHPCGREVEQIKKAGSSAASLTAQLLAFSRKQVLQVKVLDMNLVVVDIERILCRLIGEDIDLLSIPAQSLWPVMADPAQIGQVLMNLAINARDAMPQGGKLTIETANVLLDEGYALRHAGVQPGEYVMLAVSDTGSGMDEVTMARIFEPFFTTKEKGRGTGLGLATVFGIVKQSGGHIWVYSEPGRGATFKVYLPRAAVHDNPVGMDSEPTGTVQGGSETVLLVEDDDLVRALAGQGLSMSGYSVLDARNGEEALQICQEEGDQIRLVITDVVLPGISGCELAGRIQSVSPGVKVLYVSGYTDNAIVHHGVLDSGKSFLQKPFTPEALARKVREVLDKP